MDELGKEAHEALECVEAEVVQAEICTGVQVIKQQMEREALSVRHEELVHTLYDGIDLTTAKVQMGAMHLKDQVKVLRDARSCEKQVNIDHKITGVMLLGMFPIAVEE